MTALVYGMPSSRPKMTEEEKVKARAKIAEIDEMIEHSKRYVDNNRHQSSSNIRQGCQDACTINGERLFRRSILVKRLRDAGDDI